MEPQPEHGPDSRPIAISQDGAGLSVPQILQVNDAIPDFDALFRPSLITIREMSLTPACIARDLGRHAYVPVWRAMQAAPAILVAAPIGARAAYLAACYPDIIADGERLERVLSRLEVYPGRRLLENWRGLAAEGAYVELIRQVVELHYDPSYERQARRSERQRLARLDLADLSDQSQSQAAGRIAEILESWRP